MKSLILKDWEVRAVLDGRKTQVRRVVKDWPPRVILPNEVRGDGIFAATRAPRGDYEPSINPHGAVSVTAWNGEKLGVKPGEFHWVNPLGKVGDRIVVKEAWIHGHVYDKFGNWTEEQKVWYRATDPEFVWDNQGTRDHINPPWRPSSAMPKWASRITLEITDIKVQRLREISEEEAIAEGCTHLCNYPTPSGYTHAGAFAQLWDAAYFDQTPWHSNPWVWVYSFKRVGGGE